MPKTLKPLTSDKNKYFIYQQQSPKKTHCHKTINNYNNTPSEFLTNKPKDHWTENKQHDNWEYFVFAANQINIAAAEFQKTKDWHHWNQLQKNYHLIKNLVNESINLTYTELDEVKRLNENLIERCTGKTTQNQTSKHQ